MSCYDEEFRFNDEMSECSMRSKARIDSLFEDSRSLCGSTIGGWYATISKRPGSVEPEEFGTEDRNTANGAVQARIEAMFASVEAENGKPGESAAAVLKVKYIGAAPVGGRVASIRGLQEPLRQLLEHVDKSVTADLEISQRGLSFRTSEIHEKRNPFRRIAVWSALRLRCKKFANGDKRHGFLPMIANDETSATNDDKHADLWRFMRGIDTNVNRYPPIFAVVMRRPGAAKLLECHAFSCSSEEDAIAAAATLYRALLADLDANRRRPRQTNGLGCASLASVASSLAEPSIIGDRGSTMSVNGQRAGPTSSVSGSIVGQPVRPPRSKKSSINGSQTDRQSVRSTKIDKIPRKKKISEIKAEDVLEARSRKEQSTSVNARVVVGGKQIREIGSNKNSRISGRDENFDDSNVNVDQTRNFASRNKERNSTNKMINRKNEKTNYDTTDRVIYGEKPEYSIWRMNNYDKLPKISKSHDYDVNTDAGYSLVEKNVENGKKDDVDRYERNEGSYDMNVGDGTSDFSGSKIDRSMEDRVKDVGNNDWLPVTIGSRDNSIYGDKRTDKRSNGRNKIYEDHFRDADKIYSIGHDDHSAMSSGKIDHNRDNRNFDNKYSIEDGNSFVRCRSNEGMKKLNDHDDRENRNHDFERSDGINTLDKPIGKQLTNGTSAMVVSNGSKVRKRSRACSEPPFGRTENALRDVQEPKLTRSQSELEVDRGDPMTRVELPRRCSFLKPGGSARLPNNVQGGTPLGFTELFDEFRNQEGLTSLDDILTAIIDPEGMSFNDLKPLYKEFLLKLAATLTQDELYQRSASIMRRRRRPQRRRSTRKPCLIGRAIKRSVSRLKGGGPTEFTSVVFPAKKLTDSFDSSSSCDMNKNHRTRVLASRLSRKHPTWRNNKSGVGQTTSEDSDTGRRLVRNGGAGANRSSSGYVSCSECSYDSESCTCVSADKCYCSLSRRVSNESAVNNNAVCACDTDSCSESNKCYCPRKSPSTTIIEQLRQRGIVPSESTLSRTESPDRAKTSRTNRGHAASKSLEFLKIRPSPGRSSSDNLALDYDLFSPGKKSQRSSTINEKVLVVSARDPHGRLIYVGGSDRDKFHRSDARRTEAHHEALSIKKSAEIAAVFGPSSLRSCNRTNSISSVKSSVSLEAGLGYLP